MLAALSLVCSIMAQDIDGIITSESRKPATIADEIRDPPSGAAYLALFKKMPLRRHSRSRRIFFNVIYERRCNVWSAALSQAKSEFDRLVGANVFGLYGRVWSSWP